MSDPVVVIVTDPSLNPPQIITIDEGPRGPTGPAGAAGSNGANGATWHDGTGAPSNGLGNNNDYYLDDATGNVYKKSAGTYSVVGNIKGPTGATGATGSAPAISSSDGTIDVTGSPGPSVDLKVHPFFDVPYEWPPSSGLFTPLILNPTITADQTVLSFSDQGYRLLYSTGMMTFDDGAGVPFGFVCADLSCGAINSTGNITVNWGNFINEGGDPNGSALVSSVFLNANKDLQADTFNILAFGTNGVANIPYSLQWDHISFSLICQSDDPVNAGYFGLTCGSIVCTELNVGDQIFATSSIIGQSNSRIFVAENQYLAQIGATSVYANNINSILQVNTSTTAVSGSSQTDLRSYTAAVATLIYDGDSLEAYAAGTFAISSGNKEIRVFFAGAQIFDSQAIAVTNFQYWELTKISVIRVNNTTVKCAVSLATSVAAIHSYVQTVVMTGLDLENSAYDLKITGQAAASNNMTCEVSKIYYSQGAF